MKYIKIVAFKDLKALLNYYNHHPLFCSQLSLHKHLLLLLKYNTNELVYLFLH